MRIERPEPPGASDASLIPMINVVFLLLVFFMVAGTIRAPDPIETTPPTSERIAEVPYARRTLHLAADGTLALDGEALGATPLAVALARPAAEDDARPVGGDPATRDEANESGAVLTLRADAGASFALLRETIDALRAAGITQVELITIRVPTDGT